MKFSVIIPARDEEKYIGACLDSVARASLPYPGMVETIVVLNRCTDNTGRIATAAGARVVENQMRNLAAIRNHGVSEAQGEIIVTIDADSTMTRNLLMETELALISGKFIGGGTMIIPERISLGIFITGFPLMLYFGCTGISCGCFWCRKDDFLAAGGFDETFYSAEDLEFARRLQRYGRSRGQRYGTLYKAYIRTSCRKFDKLGDWHLLRHPFKAWALLKNRNRNEADRYWYDFDR